MKHKKTILLTTFSQKIILITVCMLAVAGTMQAQHGVTEVLKHTQWGAKAALNIAKLNFDASEGKSENSKSVIGGAVGLTFSYAFTSQWRIHSGLEMSLKGFSANVINSSNNLTVRAAYVQIPVTCGYVLNFNKWNFEPRFGAYFAYGVAGNYGVSGAESKKTFGNKLLKPFDAGLSFGLYADNRKFICGIGSEVGLTDANGENFTVSGGTIHMLNTFLTIGYLF